MLGWLARMLGRSAPPPRAGPPPHDAGELGRLSEQTARAFLERAGFRILDANYRCPLGELDLVAEGEARLVFVEVKARRLASPLPPTKGSRAIVPDPPLGEGPGVRAATARADIQPPRPESAVDRRKQKQIGRAARHYCRARRRTDAMVRFDVIAIDWPEQGDPLIRHHRAAFRPDV